MCIFARAMYFLLFSWNLSNYFLFNIYIQPMFWFFQDITTRPEFDVLVLVSRPRHQDLLSQDRDHDQELFPQDRDQDQDLFFQDRDQDLKIRSRDGLETKTCLETSHHWLYGFPLLLYVLIMWFFCCCCRYWRSWEGEKTLWGECCIISAPRPWWTFCCYVCWPV